MFAEEQWRIFKADKLILFLFFFSFLSFYSRPFSFICFAFCFRFAGNWKWTELTWFNWTLNWIHAWTFKLINLNSIPICYSLSISNPRWLIEVRTRMWVDDATERAKVPLASDGLLIDWVAFVLPCCNTSQCETCVEAALKKRVDWSGTRFDIYDNRISHCWKLRQLRRQSIQLNAMRISSLINIYRNWISIRVLVPFSINRSSYLWGAFDLGVLVIRRN